MMSLMSTMKKQILLINIILLSLSGCSTKPTKDDLSHQETLKSRYESKSSTSYNKESISLHHYRSFNDDNLRIENPDLKFVYFPQRYKSGVSSIREVRLSMYERVHYQRGY